MKRIGLYVEDAFYEQIRKEAFDQHSTMNALILKKLGSRSPVTSNYPSENVANKPTEKKAFTIPGVSRGFCKHNAVKGLCKYGCK